MRFAALLLAAALGGCGGIGGAGGDEAPAGDARTPIRTAEGDALAPEDFAFSGEGLWDGRPSLGGVWVAHPDAAAPGRVLIRHEGSGAEVTGALFRRDGAAAGPALQVSSDAAEALGLVAGRPAPLSVTALRRPGTAEPGTAGTDAMDAGIEPGGEGPGGGIAEPAAAPSEPEAARRAPAAWGALGRR